LFFFKKSIFYTHKYMYSGHQTAPRALARRAPANILSLPLAVLIQSAPCEIQILLAPGI
jgi:hypothetical protein